MPRQLRTGAETAWPWSRPAQTQRALLYAAREEAASQAVAAARKKGGTDRAGLFEAMARAFLLGSWQRRDLALLFV